MIKTTSHFSPLECHHPRGMKYAEITDAMKKWSNTLIILERIPINKATDFSTSLDLKGGDFSW